MKILRALIPVVLLLLITTRANAEPATDVLLSTQQAAEAVNQFFASLEKADINGLNAMLPADFRAYFSSGDKKLSVDKDNFLEMVKKFQDQDAFGGPVPWKVPGATANLRVSDNYAYFNLTSVVPKTETSPEYKFSIRLRLKFRESAWRPEFALFRVANATAGTTKPAPSAGPETSKPSEPINELIGKPAPSFSFNTIHGEKIGLEDLRGKVVLLDFWATWCVPCQISLPDTQKIYEQYGGDNLQVLGMNIDQDETVVTPFVQKTGLTFPILLPGGDLEKIADAYKLVGIPTLVVIDAQGIVRDYIIGVTPREKVLESLKKTGLSIPEGTISRDNK